VVFAITVFASISASTAVVGLDPAEQATDVEESTPLEPTQVATVAATPQPAAVQPVAVADDPCSGFPADFCVEVPMPKPPSPDMVRSCMTPGDHAPDGTLAVVAGPNDQPATDAILVRFEIEGGLAIDGECFAAEAMRILGDERGWSTSEGVTFSQVGDDSYDLRIVLTSPATTDSLCYPARTAGKYSCRNDDSVVINLMRWELGTDEYRGELSTYRTYLINHEVGHFLGKGHVRCPAAGAPAPVMMQQTKGLGACLPNGWPTKDES
jgi:hypothetical protein